MRVETIGEEVEKERARMAGMEETMVRLAAVIRSEMGELGRDIR